MAGMIKTIGDLRHRIRIEKPVGTENENGVIVKGWQEVCGAWAAVKDVSGREFFQAAAQQMENVTTFTIRWRDGINTSMRVVFAAENYEITQIDHANYAGNYMQIRARKMG